MWRNKRDPRRVVDGARVGCPVRATDVDVEECFACPRVLRVVDDDPPFVVCAAWRADPFVSDLVL
jgi:hypothetical protein